MGTTRRNIPRPSRRNAGTPSGADTGNTGGSSPASAPRELVIITASGVDARASSRGLESMAGADVTGIADVLADAGVTIRPLFGLPEERLRNLTANVAAAAAETADVPDLARFYKVEAPDDRLDEIADRLRDDPSIEAAYVKPPAELADLNDMLPAPEDAPPVTPDFSPQQGYLKASPGGIDAQFAWTKPGGRGAGIRIIDIEGAWRFTHEDLTGNQGGVVGGTQSTALNWRNHGTAVIGEFGGDVNGFGVTGICPDANVRAVSIFGNNNSSSQAIMTAANLLSAGDIILIELHRAGPRFNFQAPQGQKGFIAIEWWPDDLAAIKFAVAKGIIVVEAAGNGFENLDDAIYDVRPAGFPNTWVNPFRRNQVDSGAIVVGAGAPPSGNFGADRSRLDFSNWGALIDAQGWGREVVTCGYGDLQGGPNEDLWYTSSFSGTSSASPIVVGACACVQGWLKAANKPLLTPAQMRNRLRTTGSPQQNGPNGTTAQRIGNRPNLKQLHGVLFPKSVIKDFNDNKGNNKDFEKKDVKEFDKIKETKEFDKVKDTKEFKDVKEKEKDVVEKNFDKPREQLQPTGGPQSGGTIAQRVAALEQNVQSLQHFIAAELRPDLMTSALSAEADLQNAEALSQQLQKQASDAKSLKDDKDIEKTRDR